LLCPRFFIEATLSLNREFLDTAEEIGVNFFDHANIYGRGRSEEVFGRVLKERPSLRDRIVIQPKCGIRWADDPPGTPPRFDFIRVPIDCGPAPRRFSVSLSREEWYSLFAAARGHLCLESVYFEAWRLQARLSPKRCQGTSRRPD
jgi:predicted oxidoreductase